MRTFWILPLLFVWDCTPGQIIDIGISRGIAISMNLESCIDFGSLKGYDSISIVTKRKAKLMSVSYEDNKLTQVTYIDSVNGSIMATKSYKYTESGLPLAVEQSDTYVDGNGVIVGKKTKFKKFYEHDSLGRLTNLTDVFYDQSVTAKVTYSQGGIEIRSSEPHGRLIVIAYDDNQRIKSRKEYNRHGYIVNEWSYSYEKRRQTTVTFKIYRDAMDDIEVTPRSFIFFLDLDKRGVPTKIIDGPLTLYFCYYKGGIQVNG